MTFSLVARCAETGQMGTAISSSAPAVAARCSHVRAGVGAVSTQNVTDPSLGPRMLDLMGSGLSAVDALADLRATAPLLEYRQILAVDPGGGVAIHTGERVLGLGGEAIGLNVVSGGNLLAAEDVPRHMVAAFEAATGHLGARLLQALRAGRDAGGEAGPVHSAGLMVCDQVSWPVVDLRCDWSTSCPIEVLGEAWEVYAPQIDDYVTRAVTPSAAPSYGVPGDE